MLVVPRVRVGRGAIAVRNSNLTHGLPHACREGKQKAVELKGYGLSTPRVQGGELAGQGPSCRTEVYPTRVGRGTPLVRPSGEREGLPRARREGNYFFKRREMCKN